MKFFHILLTVSVLFCKVPYSFAIKKEIFIIATVNQVPITNIDLQQRQEVLKIFMPNFKNLSSEQKEMYAMQHLIQDALKKDYIKRIGIKISDEDLKQQTEEFVKTMKKTKIADIHSFMSENQDFAETEISWNVVVEKQIKPNINISNEMVEAIQKEQPQMTKGQISQILMIQQIEMQTNQILESLRKISVIDVVSN